MFRQTRATTVVQPATEVLDSFRVGTAQPQPSVLDGVVGLAHRAEHPVGHGSQTRSVLLESFGQPFALVHRCHVPPPCHDKAEQLRSLGAEPVVLNALDARAVRKTVDAAEADAVVHEATALTDARFSKNLDRTLEQTNRLRMEGTDALLGAAREAGVRRFVAQSFASMRYAREGGPVKTEDDPLDPAPVSGMRETVAAMRYLDQAVTDAGGIALRYGLFYGAANDGLIEPVRKRQFPIVGDGGGVSSFVHLDDAAAATVVALEHEGPAIYNIVDDEPATVREWLPVLAEALGAKPPRHFPVWLARVFAGDPGVMLGTESRGASNAKAKRELGWTLRYPSWRQGFAEVYARPTADAAAQVATAGT
jgi:nucleoside-diphosphate-sugar epimerase